MAELPIEDSKYIREVAVTMKSTAEVAYNVQIKVGTLNKAPSVPEAPGEATGEVYKYFEITKYGIVDVEIEKVVIRFRVDKEWLRGNAMDPTSVALYRYYSEDFEWRKLNTSVEREDPEYVYYSTVTPKLSYYMIKGKKGSLKETPAPTQPSPTPKPQITSPPVTPPEAVEPTPQPPIVAELAPVPEEPEEAPKTKTTPIMVALVLLLIVGGMVYVYMKRRSRKPPAKGAKSGPDKPKES